MVESHDGGMAEARCISNTPKRRTWLVETMLEVLEKERRGVSERGREAVFPNHP